MTGLYDIKARMKIHSVKIKNIGNVTFIKSLRASRVSIRVQPFEGVRVTLPVTTSYSRALQFVELKKKWIIRQLEKSRRKEEMRTLLNPDSVYEICKYNLLFTSNDKMGTRIRITDGGIYIPLPPGSDYSDPGIQDKIRTGVIEALRIEAKKSLPERVAELAEQHGFRYKNVHIRNARTRWGSCSTGNNINLNLHVIRLPAHIADYVILHELAHTVYKNHGRDFWTLLDRITGDARSRERELKQYNTQIF